MCTFRLRLRYITPLYCVFLIRIGTIFYGENMHDGKIYVFVVRPKQIQNFFTTRAMVLNNFSRVRIMIKCRFVCNVSFLSTFSFKYLQILSILYPILKEEEEFFRTTMLLQSTQIIKKKIITSRKSVMLKH